MLTDDKNRMTIPFSVQIVLRDNGPGVWKTARVDIFEGKDVAARQIGSYERNHAGWCAETFAPFMQDGCWFALYAPDYTATRIMELPSCKDLGGEEPTSHGFCPVVGVRTVRIYRTDNNCARKAASVLQHTAAAATDDRAPTAASRKGPPECPS